MSLSLPWLALLVSLLSLVTTGYSQRQCASMVGTPLQRCNVAGYNSTFPVPFNMSDSTKLWVSEFIEYVISMTESNNCSAGLQRIGEMIVCGIYVPRCKQGNLLLPCKRVCVEYFKKCTGHIDPFWFDYYIAHCTLLPDLPASSGKCFEPANFDKNFNVTSTGILKGKCHNLIFPWCKGLGYQYTIMQESTQIDSYKYLYGKNFTNTSADNVVLNTSAINYWFEFQKNHSNCEKDIQKTLCADLFPPCFPHEGTALYSVCHKTCLDMRNKCPRIADHPTFLGNFFNACEAWAAGDSEHGYCKQTSWPKPLLWINYFKEKKATTGPTTSSQKISTPIPTYIIVIVVVIPLISLIIIAAVYLWRQRKLPWFVRMFKRGEDTKDIVEGDIPEIPEIPPEENSKP